MLNLFFLNLFVGFCSLIFLNLGFFFVYCTVGCFDFFNVVFGLKNHRFHLGFLRILSLLRWGFCKVDFFLCFG